MDTTITFQSVPSNQSITTPGRKSDPTKDARPYVINLVCGALAGFVSACAADNSQLGPYGAHILAGMCIGTLATATTNLVIRRLHNRAAAVTDQARETPTNTAAPVEAELQLLSSGPAKALEDGYNRIL